MFPSELVAFACEEVIGQQVGVAFDLIDSKMAEVAY